MTRVRGAVGNADLRSLRLPTSPFAIPIKIRKFAD